MFVAEDHVFAVCAYKESDFLEECVKSLLGQKVRSRIIIATSTPNASISAIADEFGLELFVNSGQPGIGSDWNFAYAAAVPAKLITIAHQDDIYCEDYTSTMLETLNSAKDPLIFFTDYAEIRASKVVDNTGILKLKRVLLAPLKLPALWNSRFARRRILSFGSAICCPSVTLISARALEPPFDEGLKCDLDWNAWEQLSKQPGAFVYSPKILMQHRIHAGSETTAAIENNTRTQEDQMMFERFWPKPIARLINRFYSSSQKSNA